MPARLTLNPEEGIPPFAEEIVMYEEQDVPMIIETATQLMLHDMKVQGYLPQSAIAIDVAPFIEIAGKLVRETGLHVQIHNAKNKEKADAHVAAHTRIIRPTKTLAPFEH